MVGGDIAFQVRNALIVNTAFSVNSTGIYFSNVLFANTTTVNNAAYLGGTVASGYQTTAGLASNVAGLSANNSTYLNGIAASSYVNTSGAFSLSGVITHTGNLVFGSGAQLSANGTVGTANQVLTSNGTIPYWASLASGMISGLVASATTDTTNATNISTGTLAQARLANVLFTNVAAQTISGGARITPYSIGIVSSGTTTIDTGNGPLQYLTNNGAFTLAAPANDGSCVLLIINGSAAGAMANSGFTNGSNIGDTYNTTNTNKFMIYIVRINGTSTFSIKALQA